MVFMSHPSDYRKAYETAKRELHELLALQQKTEKRIVTVRESLQLFARLCEEDEVDLTLSPEAVYLLEKSKLGDEIRSILIAEYPSWVRPNSIKDRLERLGHDLSKYSNPQASIHMVLKRWVENNEAQEGQWPEDGKKIYRIPRTPSDWDDDEIKRSITEQAKLFELVKQAVGRKK
jgi:hypothetical protein